MSRIIAIIMGVLIIAASIYYGFSGHEKKGKIMGYNHLSKEKSPYLLQHKDNPVHWYAWGEEAFQAARDQKKPIFLSIGYSTCHWCHVMEKDSFEREDVARILNEHFICIKVDREERPDVDQLYMEAVVALSGHGGWPMSVFLTADLKPFFGGTFFWRAQFMELLGKVSTLWETDHQKIRDAGDDLVKHLSSVTEGGVKSNLTGENLESAVSVFKQSFDPQGGGFGRAPKFPRSFDLSLLMRLYQKNKDPQILTMVDKTLDAMARGGIYDHLGGGFARYATDEKWLIPHFEKMLYDNALLVNTYAEAYQLTKNPVYKQIVKETLDYVVRDMTSPEGGFYSAEDADSEGHEGKFYVWSYAELKNILLPDELNIMEKVFGVTAQGNFEGNTNILNLPLSSSWEDRNDERITNIRTKLFNERKKRVHPLKDKKIITEWNGLMIGAMVKGYQISGDEKYLSAAQKAALFIKNNLYINDSLKRRYCEGETRFEGVLNDYAYLVWGLLELYQADFDLNWIKWVQTLDKKQDELFWDSKEGGYYFSALGLADLFHRKVEVNDGATPSANGVSVLNHLKLFSLTYDESHMDKAQKIMELVSKYINRYPPGFASTLMALDYSLGASREIVVLAKKDNQDWLALKKYLSDGFYPGQVLVYSEKQNETLSVLKGKEALGDFTVYICENHTCQAPLKDFESVKSKI